MFFLGLAAHAFRAAVLVVTFAQRRQVPVGNTPHCSGNLHYFRVLTPSTTAETVPNSAYRHTALQRQPALFPRTDTQHYSGNRPHFRVPTRRTTAATGPLFPRTDTQHNSGNRLHFRILTLLVFPARVKRFQGHYRGANGTIEATDTLEGGSTVLCG